MVTTNSCGNSGAVDRICTNTSRRFNKFCLTISLLLVMALLILFRILASAASYASAYLFFGPKFCEYNFTMRVGDVLVHREGRDRGIERVKDDTVTYTDAGNVNLLYWRGFFWTEIPPCALVHILLCLVALYVWYTGQAHTVRFGCSAGQKEMLHCDS